MLTGGVAGAFITPKGALGADEVKAIVADALAKHPPPPPIEAPALPPAAAPVPWGGLPSYPYGCYSRMSASMSFFQMVNTGSLTTTNSYIWSGATASFVPVVAPKTNSFREFTNLPVSGDNRD